MAVECSNQVYSLFLCVNFRCSLDYMILFIDVVSLLKKMSNKGNSKRKRNVLKF